MPVIGIWWPFAVVFQKYHTIEARQMRVDRMGFCRRTKASRQIPLGLGRQLLVAEEYYEMLDNSFVNLLMDIRIDFTRQVNAGDRRADGCC